MSFEYKEHRGRQYLPWWEPTFPAHVFVDNNSNDSPFYMKTITDAFNWLHSTYPDLVGDKALSRNDESEKPWHQYDWGIHREGDQNIFYFKDPQVAIHFKLAFC